MKRRKVTGETSESDEKEEEEEDEEEDGLLGEDEYKQLRVSLAGVLDTSGLPDDLMRKLMKEAIPTSGGRSEAVEAGKVNTIEPEDPYIALLMLFRDFVLRKNQY